MTTKNLERAREIVDGFFIGGRLDSLEQPNLTKGDLIHCFSNALTQVEDEAYERAAKVADDQSNEAAWADSFDARDTGGDKRAREIAQAIRLKLKGGEE